MAQRTRVPITVTSGQGTGGSGTVAELDYFLSDDEVMTSITPAAASHTAGFTVGPAGASAALTFAGIGQSGTMIRIIGAKLLINSATVPASAFTLWLFNSAPTVVNGNTAFGVLSADKAKFIKKINLGTPTLAGVSGTATVSAVQQDGIAVACQLTGTSIVAYLTVDSTVTLVAQLHEVTLQTEPLS